MNVSKPSKEQLARFSDKHLAYVKALTGAEALELFPGSDDISPDSTLYCLFRGDGSPLVLTNYRYIAIANAEAYSVVASSVH